MTVIMESGSQVFFQTWLGKFFLNGTTLFLVALREIFLFLGLLKFDSVSLDGVSDRGLVLIEEARARGHEMSVMRAMGKATDIFKIKTSTGAEMIFGGLPYVGPEVATEWIDDKAVIKQFLTTGGITVSKGQSFSSWRKAEVYFDQVEKPLIIKPRLGSRGRHTTTHIYSKEAFKKAFKVAKKLGHFVVVEEHLTGSVYRGTVVDGKLVGVLAGDPPRITGDGVSTIKQLIEQKNLNRHERVGEVRYTETLDRFLKRISYNLDSILESGKTIDLTEKIGLSYGGNAREVTPMAHPMLRAELERAAKLIGYPFLGFDFISTDISADPSKVKWGIIECNTAPFINLHHDPLEGEPINAAGKVLDYFEQNIGKTKN